MSKKYDRNVEKAIKHDEGIEEVDEDSWRRRGYRK